MTFTATNFVMFVLSALMSVGRLSYHRARSLYRRTNLHLCGAKLLPLPVVPRHAVEAGLAAVLVLPVEQREPAVVEPPACLPLPGTGPVAALIVVAVFGGEHLAVVLL